MSKRESPIVAHLLDALGEKGYRDTAPRRAIVQAVAQTEKHFSAEDLRAQLPEVGRATIYRSLKLLLDAGVVCRVLLEDGELHYQLSHQGHHHHLLCVHCGSSQDLTGCDIEDVLIATSSRHGFELSGHWLEVYGRCRECLENAQAAA